MHSSSLSRLARLLENGLAWMVLAQVFFAGMNVSTRALHRAVPVTGLSGLGIVLTHLLAIPVFDDRPTAWQLAGMMLVIGASVLLALGRETAPAGIRPPS